MFNDVMKGLDKDQKNAINERFNAITKDIFDALIKNNATLYESIDCLRMVEQDVLRQLVMKVRETTDKAALYDKYFKDGKLKTREDLDYSEVK